MLSIIKLEKGKKNLFRAKVVGNSWTLWSTENAVTRRNTQKIRPPMDASAKTPWLPGKCQVTFTTENRHSSISVKSRSEYFFTCHLHWLISRHWTPGSPYQTWKWPFRNMCVPNRPMQFKSLGSRCWLQITEKCRSFYCFWTFDNQTLS